MNNKYIFIIWNKALFCEERIFNDLSHSFNILKKIYIQWDKDKFKDNLKALYGCKAINLDYKISCIGKGKFCLLIVQDNNPIYKTNENNETININVYNKKWLYRKWVSGGFRIHSSLNEEETNHDLLVLFGPNYRDLLFSFNENNIIKTNTCGLEGFKSYQDFEISIKILDNKIKTITSENDLVIITKNRNNLIRFLAKYKMINNNKYVINFVNGQVLLVYIFGIEENETPKHTSFYNNFLNNIYRYREEYAHYLNSDLDYTKSKYYFILGELSIENNQKPIDTILPDLKFSFLDKLKSFIKYYSIRFISK